MNPRVSVIVATYNRSELLPYSLGSVLRQTFRDFEVLVVGDGCTDDSEQVVAAIGDPRVRWIGLPRNSGHQSAPNNEGLRQARAEIVAYLGHDDLWLPHHLEAHVQTLEQASSDFAYSLCLLVAPNGMSWPTVPAPRVGRFSPPTCTTHRRSVTEELGGWVDHRTIAQAPDVELWQRANTNGRKFTFVQRLTGIKFPAAWRRDVYRIRAYDEQQQWLARIDADPYLEQSLLVNCVTDGRVPSALPYRDLLRLVVQQTASRIRRRLVLPRTGPRKPRHGDVDMVRRFKGL